MAILGNIVTTRGGTYEKIFNVSKTCEGTVENLPTLYVGLSSAKECIDNFSILRKYYPEQNAYWVFSKNERRDDYIEGLIDFKKLVIMSYLEKIRYEYIDFTNYPLSRIRKLISYMNMRKEEKYCFLTKSSQFVFIYAPRLSVVFGLSLTLCEYLGISKGKVISRLKRNKSNKFIYDLSFIDGDIKRIIGDNTHCILPMYCCLTEEESGK